MKKFIPIVGLPRTMSTTLTHLLFANPTFGTSSTSGLIDVVNLINQNWENIASHKTYPTGDRNYFSKDDVSYRKKLNTLKSTIEGYYNDFPDRNIVFDKNRMWLNHIPLLEEIFEQKIKMIVTVRNIPDILASLEKVYQNKGSVITSQEQQHPLMMETLDGRLQVWTEKTEILGRPYTLLQEAIRVGYKDRLYFCEFERFTTTPEIVMREIYEFIDEPYFEHNFDNFELFPHLIENDRFWMSPYHSTTRTKIEPVPPQWPKYLGKLADKYKNLELW